MSRLLVCLLMISLNILAAEPSFLGEYSLPTAIRFFGYTEQDCATDKGVFITENQACQIPAQNSISIEVNNDHRLVVKISVIFGPANMRDFTGVVTQMKGSTLSVKEARVSDDGKVEGLVRHGCTGTVTIVKNKAVLNLAENCDADLWRASDAVKN